MKEIWKNIKDYEGIYQVSNFGRVRSLDRYCWNGHKNHFKRGKILKLQTNMHYNKISLSKKGKVKQFLVHRLVAKAFIKNPKNKPEVNHIDKNCFNNKICNLEWVTAKENDTHKRGNK